MGIRENMKTLIKQIAGMLDTTPAEYERGDHQRVVQLFGNTVSQCKEAIQTGLQKESAFPSRDAFTQTYGNEAGQMMDQITITESPAVQVDNEMIRENNQGMNSVYEKLTDLHEISKDTAFLVDSQQQYFDQSEKASAAASARSKQAVRHLETGMQYQRQSRRKQCCIVLSVIAGIVVIAFILALFVGLTKGLF